MSAEWRIIAQRILTGEFLTWDLPLNGSAATRALSGPGGITGTVEPEMLRLRADDGRPLLEEWSTALYVEQAGQIRGGAIVNKIDYDGPAKRIESVGFCGYPHGIPYADDYMPTDFKDPLEVFRHIWWYVQKFPDADLGMKVGSDTSWFQLSSGSGPYTIRWFDYRDCGEELDSLATAVPFDYRERHRWANDAHTAIEHHIDLGFPRLGRKRTDLRFAESENIVSHSPIGADGEQYANHVTLIGEGEGRVLGKATAAARDGRLRRSKVVPKKAARTGMLDRMSQHELRNRALAFDITEVSIIDHPNARISAIDPGDDVLVEVEVEWLGDVRLWLRVLAVEESGDVPGAATLRTQRSSAFVYADAKSPDGEKHPLSV